MKSSIPALIAVAAIVSGCAGMDSSKMTYSTQQQVNEPQKAQDCYDAAVLLGANVTRTQDITKKVLVAVDASVESETADAIKAQRNRHFGVLVGSGGEELFINWKALTPEQTYVTVATKTGLFGAAGQKAWSCQVVDEMVKMAK